MTQGTLFNDGAKLRDKGIKQAVDHAEDVHAFWHAKAYAFLRGYARTHREFSGEMVRNASRDIVPRPPSLRAWGAIFVIARKEGWIRQIDYIKVKNPKAHCANAALWESKL